MNTKQMFLAMMMVGALGCASTKKQVTLPAEDTVGVANSGPATKEAPAKEDGERSDASERTVYFDYNSAEIEGQNADRIERIAQTLQAEPDSQVLIEGHADERGSTEFNLALGEKRAMTTKKNLTRYGIPAKRINIISYGEERPAVAGANEAAWANNRRAEIVVE